MPVLARKSRLNWALSENPAQKPIMVIEASPAVSRRQASVDPDGAHQLGKTEPALAQFNLSDEG